MWIQITFTSHFALPTLSQEAFRKKQSTFLIHTTFVFFFWKHTLAWKKGGEVHDFVFKQKNVPLDYPHSSLSQDPHRQSFPNKTDADFCAFWCPFHYQHTLEAMDFSFKISWSNLFERRDGGYWKIVGCSRNVAFSITSEGQLLPSHVFACQTPHLPQTKCQGNSMAPKEPFAKVDRTTWSTI